MSTPATDIATMTYEQARDELVTVVQRLEAGDQPLEASLELWERGEALAARCQEWLDGAERRRLAAARRHHATPTEGRCGPLHPEESCTSERPPPWRRPSMSERRALVIGEALIDVVHRAGRVQRRAPRREPDQRRDRPGAARTRGGPARPGSAGTPAATGSPRTSRHPASPSCPAPTARCAPRWRSPRSATPARRPTSSTSPARSRRTGRRRPSRRWWSTPARSPR